MTVGDALAAVLADSQTILPVNVVFWAGRASGKRKLLPSEVL